MELVAELGLRAAAPGDVQPLMGQAAELVARTLGTELAGVVEALPGHERLLLRAGCGWEEGAVGRATVQAGTDSFLGRVVATGQAGTTEDVSSDGRFGPSRLLLRHGAAAGAAVVVAGPAEPFGALAVFARKGRRFEAGNVHFLQVVANVISAAVDRAAAGRRLDEALGAERARIARDLQDDALPALRPAAGGDRVADILQRVARRLGSAIYDLRLEEDRPLSFADGLRGLVEVHGADGEVVLEAGDPFPGGSFGRRGAEVLRIVGEALTNAGRHAGDRPAVVRAWGSARRFTVEVADGGPGFDAGAEPRGRARYGLRRMRERADALGAELHVRSDRDGTTVRLDAALEASARPTRVLIVGDHATMRQALAVALERHADIEVVGVAGSLAEGRRRLAGVDVALIDPGLPGGYGGELIKELRRLNPSAQALVLGAGLDRGTMARAVAHGAGGVLDKTVGLDEVVAAVRQLRAGEAVMSPSETIELLRLAASQREREDDDRAKLAHLTRRELEVLEALANGLSSQEIAAQLHITVRTERNHMANILTKLDVHSQLQALLLAMRYGTIALPGPAGATG